MRPAPVDFLCYEILGDDAERMLYVRNKRMTTNTVRHDVRKGILWPYVTTTCVVAPEDAVVESIDGGFLILHPAYCPYVQMYYDESKLP